MSIIQLLLSINLDRFNCFFPAMAEIMEWEESQFALWVIRHCDREDVNNPTWFVNTSSNPHSLARDNTPISRQGRKQGEQLRERFSNIKLDHIFASPFERTIETASLIAAKQPLSTIKVIIFISILKKVECYGLKKSKEKHLADYFILLP